MNRIHEAICFLKEIKSNNLVHKLNKYFINPPTRLWINGILEELESHIINRRLIDEKRLDSCSNQVVKNFFLKYSNFIRSFKKFLFFGADETMIEVLPRKSYVVPDDVKVVFHEKYPDNKHIFAMMCHCVAGNSLTLFIILTNLQNLPNELEGFQLKTY